MRFTIMISVLLFLITACNSKKEVQKDPDIYYTCSMDPQVKEFKPGKCPICRMELTPVKKSNGASKDEIQLSAQQMQLGNIQTETIGNGSYWRPDGADGNLEFRSVQVILR